MHLVNRTGSAHAFQVFSELSLSSCMQCAESSAEAREAFAQPETFVLVTSVGEILRFSIEQSVKSVHIRPLVS